MNIGSNIFVSVQPGWKYSQVISNIQIRFFFLNKVNRHLKSMILGLDLREFLI